MTRDALKAGLKKRLEVYCLSDKVNWDSSTFGERSFKQFSNKKVIQADLCVTDYVWIGAIREIVKEYCEQVQQDVPTIRVERLFRTVWTLEDLKSFGQAAVTKGIPLCPSIRYLATLRSGAAFLSTIIDIHVLDGQPEPSLDDIRKFIAHQLSNAPGQGWNPEAEPMLTVSADVVKYYSQ